MNLIEATQLSGYLNGNIYEVENGSAWVCHFRGSMSLTLDGEFTAVELRALADYADKHKGS